MQNVQGRMEDDRALKKVPTEIQEEERKRQRMDEDNKQKGSEPPDLKGYDTIFFLILVVLFFVLFYNV